MNIKNIAIVRATNIIPLDGVVHPISEVPYLKKENGTAFAYAIDNLLKKLSIINQNGYWSMTEEEQKEMLRQNKETLEQYLPYNSDYNSMVLWALNGLVPDDINNTFSNKTCAVIDSLEEQIDRSEMISLIPTDTAIKGSVKLSDKAIILIRRDRYDSLGQQDREQLEKLNLTVQIFDGEIQEAVNKTLEDSKTYTAENLSLKPADKGYLESNTKGELIDTIQEIASTHNIAQVLYWNIITGQNDESEKLESVKNEHRNFIRVEQCYQKTFLQYISSKLNIDQKIIESMLWNMDSPRAAEDLCAEIERIGLDEYKRVVEQYNSSLENLKKQGKLPTPEQIVHSIKQNRAFNLLSLINESEQNQEQSKTNSKFDIYLSKLQEKYGYRDDLVGTLRKIIPAFVQHFGEENEQLILDAISSCEIHLQEENEDTIEYLSNYFQDEEEKPIPTIAVAFYSSSPSLNNDSVSSKRLIYITSKGSNDLQEETTISKLVHELGHLIKGYNKEFEIIDGQLHKRSGVSTTVIDRNKQTGKYVDGEKYNIGIEEAINCYDEERVMSLILGREYKVDTYGHHLNDGIDLLYQNKELIDSFRHAQLYGTDEHIKLLGKDYMDRISYYFDKVYYPFIAPYSERRNGGTKLLIKQRDEAKLEIEKLASEYKKNKEENFSLETVEQIDEAVTFDKRILGAKDLKKAIRKMQEEKDIVEEQNK